MIEQFWLFHCGWFRVPKGAFEKGAGFEVGRMPFLAAVAYHPERGPIVVDAPFGHEGPANAGEVIGSFLRRTGQKFRPQWAIVPRIEQLGFRPSEVDDILMTHLHWDHTGGMKQLAHAHFWVSETEWDFATGLGPMEAVAEGYAPGDYRALQSRVRRLDLSDEVDIAGGFDVFGDGSVEAVPLPGHSPGHVGYRFRLTDGRTIFFVGDAVFTLPQITEGRAFGFFPRIAATDADRAQATVTSLRDWWRTDGRDQILVSSHDFGWGEECLDGPTPLHGED
jgi:glyoxylase-like metal-dependent hydrolase (beta-lactamase superfamily II)